MEPVKHYGTFEANPPEAREASSGSMQIISESVRPRPVVVNKKKQRLDPLAHAPQGPSDYVGLSPSSKMKK